MDIGTFFIIFGSIAAILFFGYLGDKDNKKRAAERQRRLDEIKEASTQAMQGPAVNLNVSGSGVNEALRMAQVKCVQCGASIEPGMKFCSHCGTQVPDDAFHAEINVNDPARMEAVRLQAKIDQAKIANQKILAQAEAKKIKAQVKKQQAELRAKKGYFVLGILCALCGLAIAIWGLVVHDEYMGSTVGFGVMGLVFGIVMALVNRT